MKQSFHIGILENLFSGTTWSAAAPVWRLVASRRAATVCLLADVIAVMAIIQWLYWLID